MLFIKHNLIVRSRTRTVVGTLPDEIERKVSRVGREVRGQRTFLLESKTVIRTLERNSLLGTYSAPGQFSPGRPKENPFVHREQVDIMDACSVE